MIIISDFDEIQGDVQNVCKINWQGNKPQEENGTTQEIKENTHKYTDNWERGNQEFVRPDSMDNKDKKEMKKIDVKTCQQKGHKKGEFTITTLKRGGG